MEQQLSQFWNPLGICSIYIALSFEFSIGPPQSTDWVDFYFLNISGYLICFKLEMRLLHWNQPSIDKNELKFVILRRHTFLQISWSLRFNIKFQPSKLICVKCLHWELAMQVQIWLFSIGKKTFINKKLEFNVQTWAMVAMLLDVTVSCICFKHKGLDWKFTIRPVKLG